MSSVHDATSLLADKRRRRARRRLRTLLGGLLGLVLVGVATWALLFSSLLALTEVRVEGTHAVSADEVRTAAAAPMGRSLLRVQERPVAERVAGLAPVDHVTVSRRLPHALQITVVEREPVFAVARGTSWALVDPKGIPYLEVNEKPEALVPAFAGSEDGALLKAVGQVVNGLPPQLRDRLEKVEAKSGDTITLKLKEGREVVVGSADELELKMKVAATLLQATPAKWIDVTAPGHPATR
ncbi:hypothetical protein GCM10027418_14640 [Mariniluteicoccus endophyticus]